MDGASSPGGLRADRDAGPAPALRVSSPPPLACDLHPDYFTTRWAAARGKPVIPVQHHHAHAVAGMVEHGLLDREVLAVTWDGTGYGPDGTVWGGEVLRARVDGFERVASLRPFPLPGGEKAIRQPRRVALGLLRPDPRRGRRARRRRPAGAARALPARRRGRCSQMVRRGVNTPWTSSVGRLFDAVAALLLGAGEVSLRGRGRGLAGGGRRSDRDRRLRAAAPPAGRARRRRRPRGPARGLAADGGGPPGRPGVRGRPGRHRRPVPQHPGAAGPPPWWPGNRSGDVVLGGGCFQNRLLTERTIEAIRETGARVYGPGSIPPGDGGLAAGQLAVAMSVLARRESRADNR